MRDKEKQRMVDSIFQQGRIDYSAQSYRGTEIKEVPPVLETEKDSISDEEEPITAKELALEQ